MYIGLFQKKIQAGVSRIYFFEEPPGVFFLFYPCKFQTKQSSAPGYSTKLC